MAPEVYKTCEEPCKGKEDRVPKLCCFNDCALKASNLLNETGFIDFEAVKTALIEKAENDEKWTAAINAAVEVCIVESM